MADNKFDPNKMHFFYKHNYLGSCEPGDAWCPKLLELMESDPDVASMILDYMNSLGDPVFPVSEKDWGTPETDITKVDIEDLYNTFLQELDYEYRDFPGDFYVGGDYRLPDFEIFVGEVAEENVVSTTKIKASRYDNVPGYKAPTGGYLYIFKHGIGPGTMPDDVHIVRVKDLPNGYTAVWLSDFLTTDELKKYDIPAETEINRYLNRIGYCQKKGDVVPCTADPYGFDDVIGSCDKKPVEAATDANKYTIKSVSDEGTYYLVKDWRKNRELWVSKEKMDKHPEWWFVSSGKAKQSLKSLLSVMDEYLSDTFTVVDTSGNETSLDVKELGFDHIPDYEDDDVDACNDIKASTDSEPNFNVTRLVEQFFTEVQELVEYFRYHNKNLNKRQDELIENLSDALDSRSTTAAREAIENLNYNTKGMYKAQEYYVTDLYAELCYADGKYSGLGRTYADDAINGSTKYTADMCSVGASDDGYAQLAEGDDADTEEYIENGKYYVAGYLQSSYRGLMEDMYSDDFEEILTNAADMAGQGLYVEITNRADGRSERYTPEDFEEAASNGEYPDHIREDLAL